MDKEEILRAMFMRAVIADDPMSDLGEYLEDVTPEELRWAESKSRGSYTNTKQSSRTTNCVDLRGGDTMEKYLWLTGDEGDMTEITTFNTYQELVDAVQTYLVSYYGELLEDEPDTDKVIEWVKGAVTLKELHNAAEGFFWGANDSKVFNFIKVTEFGSEIL